MRTILTPPAANKPPAAEPTWLERLHPGSTAAPPAPATVPTRPTTLQPLPPAGSTPPGRERAPAKALKFAV
ncbi:MAG: hypothetical protein J0M20_09870 [Burkholderiales bacterium]|nr:hypothetical protein [Burkholderiales bacterium]